MQVSVVEGEILMQIISTQASSIPGTAVPVRMVS